MVDGQNGQTPGIKLTFINTAHHKFYFACVDQRRNMAALFHFTNQHQFPTLSPAIRLPGGELFKKEP
jgi:hypothetical protein